LVRSNNCSFKKVSRAHGGDIYQERHLHQYLSFRQALVKRLDKIYPVSENGSNYIAQYTPSEFRSKLEVSRLGTLSPATFNVIATNNTLPLIVSCSYLVPVKRIHLLIEALANIKLPLRWVHLGGGPLEQSLRSLANEKLAGKANLSYTITGNLTTEEIELFYKTESVYLFINVSESEGIPVSMMEAQSHSIPILATDVGGVSEIVNTSNGKLLPATATIPALAAALEMMLQLDNDSYQRLRTAARHSWERNYQAEKNFSIFAQHLAGLHETE
jgi:glycosyltransferase involved in cell wall biosynthesis